MMVKYNDQFKLENEMERNVIYNAIINANRKKGTQMIPLFSEAEEHSAIEKMQEREELFDENVLAGLFA